ncbi:esterase [Mycobacterium phage Omega]|uniref:BD-FAE-like domain-containing protein n=1 Tax=Mycobacterium phage Omega TaxID=2907835 RepID=Q854G2_BPMOM|nr:esterase [Mycobacterium phage Omega]AAN12746.1 hypothetical protein PBI_OMEGA_105 [Mycobacterium phage Omega]
MIPALAHLEARQRHLWDTVAYSGNQKLDIWLPESPENAPVFMFIPGGAWTIGDRRGQGYAIMSHLVQQGWICVAIDYRTAPKNHWPAPFEDVSAAFHWVRANIHQYGGGDFLAVGGASAGGHMASLLGLTDWSFSKPDAVVSLYGVYDWTSKSLDHWLINRYVQHVVVGRRDHDTLRISSPIHQIHRDAPPFLIIQGDCDLVTPQSGAKKFFKKLKETSLNHAVYHRVPGGIHGFDLLQGWQTDRAIDAIDDFLTTARIPGLLEAS